jgi:hypothetical protein
MGSFGRLARKLFMGEDCQATEKKAEITELVRPLMEMGFPELEARKIAGELVKATYTSGSYSPSRFDTTAF